MSTHTDRLRYNTRGSSDNVEAVSQHQLPPTSFFGSLAGMASDVISLSELQLKLFKRDTSEAIQRTYVAAGILAVGLIILLACLPIAMIATAQVIHQTSTLSLAACYTVVLGVGLTIGLVASAIGYRKFKAAGGIYRRSQDEFSENVEWLKASLKRSRGNGKRFPES